MFAKWRLRVRFLPASPSPPQHSPRPPFLPFPTLFSPWDSDGPDPGAGRNFSPFDRCLENFVDFLIVSCTDIYNFQQVMGFFDYK